MLTCDQTGDEDGDSEGDEELETAMLEKMVQKLSRIIKHVIPNGNDIAADANLDASTSNWLSQSYSNKAVASVKEPDRLRISLPAIGEYEGVLPIEDITPVISKELLDSWDFDVLEHSDDDLSEIMIFLFNSLGLLVSFQVPMATMRQFLSEISKRYIKNTYHNYNHGCDVCHTVYRLLMLSRLNELFNPLEIFSTLIGALAHDVGHPGLNNLFLVKSKHPLALTYNDKSPLENMHASVLYEVVLYVLDVLFACNSNSLDS